MRKIIRNSYSRMVNTLKVLSLEMLIVLVVFFLSFFLVLFFIREVFFKQAVSLDEKAFNFLERFISDNANSVMSFLTTFGSHKFLVPANLLLIGYAFFIMKDKWFGLKITSVALSSLALMASLKWLFGRQRPLEPLLGPVSGLSFPSGHAFMSFAFFGLLIYSAHKQIGHKPLRIFIILFLLAFIIVIGISRIYLRVHYFSDVIAGLGLGMMWLVISVHIMNKLEKKNKRELPIA